ncbi:MAG: histidine kinase [Alloprevotella sp.]|nr:histidine kinase [Alloprevotella sp.]
MTRKRIEILVAVALNIIIWLYVIVSPVLTHPIDKPFTLQDYFRMLMFPLTDCFICYLNYYLLIPRYLKYRRLWRFLVLNLVTIGLLATLRVVLFPYLEAPPVPPPLDGIQPDAPGWQIYLRDSVSLAFVCVAVSGIRLGIEWLNAEENKHKTELQLKAAELKVLRNQINPHFMLNTLNNIYALINFNPQHAAEAVTQLAALLRYMLYEAPDEGVEVQRLASLCEDYINLMRIRVNKNVDVTFDSDVPDGHGPLVTTYLLMPILENAFKHGVSPTRKSYIHIILRCDESIFYFCCRNSNYPRQNNEQQQGGIGLEQVRKRLELSYPGSYTYSAGLSPDGKEYSTEIEIHFPKPASEEEQKAKGTARE